MFLAVLCSCVLSFIAVPVNSSPSSIPPVLAGIPILITHGETITKLGDVSAADKLRFPGNVEIGFKHSYFGIFWID
ncbi:MAG: hypothetical protein JWM11_3954, partial [Planctomycetaceae bacterium]|nr:hypothetical protein [Planctomycetaceae bacterium]